MKHTVFIYSTLISVFLLMPNLPFAQTLNFISFELEDQFDRNYTEQSFKGKMIVMIASDGGGSKYNSKWGKAISESLKKRGEYDIYWVGVADLRGVPFFMKGYVRNQFPEDKNEWVLMDWDGLFAETYKFKDGMSNILLFNSRGELFYKTAAKEVENDELNRIIKMIRENYP